MHPIILKGRPAFSNFRLDALKKALNEAIDAHEIAEIDADVEKKVLTSSSAATARPTPVDDDDDDESLSVPTSKAVVAAES